MGAKPQAREISAALKGDAAMVDDRGVRHTGLVPVEMIRSDWELHTGQVGSIQLAVANSPGQRLILHLGNQTLLKFEEVKRNAKNEIESATAYLKSGKVRLLEEKGKLAARVEYAYTTRWRVRTPTAVTSPRGTEYEISVDDSNTTHVRVFSGSVEIAPIRGGSSLVLNAGETITVDKDGKFGDRARIANSGTCWDARCKKNVPCGSMQCEFEASASAPVLSENWMWCINEDDQFSSNTAISGCTAVIRSGRENKNNLGIAYSNRCNLYNQNKEYDRAIIDCTEAVRLDQRNYVAFENRAGAYSAKGNTDRALSDYNQSIRINPGNPQVFNNRGITFADRGEYDRAIVDYGEAIRLDPNNATPYYNRGIAWSDKGDNDRAIADYNEVIRLDPNNANAYYNRAVAWTDKGDNNRAFADFDQAIRLNPKDADAYFNRGIAWAGKGDNDRAIADFDQTIRLDPKNANAYYNRGTIWSRKGEHDRAIADHDQAIRLDPNNVNPYFNRGVAWSDKGDNDRAIADYNEVIRLDPNNANAYYNRGIIWEMKRDFRKALADFKKFTELAPSDPDGPIAVERATKALGGQ